MWETHTHACNLSKTSFKSTHSWELFQKRGYFEDYSFLTLNITKICLSFSFLDSSQVSFSESEINFFEFLRAPERAQPIQILKNKYYDWSRKDYHFKPWWSHEDWKNFKYHMLERFMVDDDLIFGYVSRWEMKCDTPTAICTTMVSWWTAVRGVL